MGCVEQMWPHVRTVTVTALLSTQYRPSSATNAGALLPGCIAEVRALAVNDDRPWIRQAAICRIEECQTSRGDQVRLGTSTAESAVCILACTQDRQWHGLLHAQRGGANPGMTSLFVSTPCGGKLTPSPISLVGCCSKRMCGRGGLYY